MRTLNTVFKKRYIWWGVSLVLVWVLSKSITLAGRDALHPKSSALAMRGQNLYARMKIIAEGKDGFAFDRYCSSDDLIRKTLEGVPDLMHLAFDDEGCLWNVLAGGLSINVADWPFLISANFNPSLIDCRDENVPLPIGIASGASRSMLNDRAVVVVRNDGKAQVIKAEQLTRKSLLRGATNNVGQVEALTPYGRETLNFGCVDK